MSVNHALQAPIRFRGVVAILDFLVYLVGVEKSFHTVVVDAVLFFL